MAKNMNYFLQSLLLPLLIILSFPKYCSYAEVGTSSRYGPQFLPTACYGYDASQLPANNFFAAAGDIIWDNGAACGRQYSVKCMGETCADTVIQVIIVDYAITSVSRPSHEGTSMALSDAAFKALTSNSTADYINIDFQRQCFINKKWILRIIQKTRWSFKLDLKAQTESWKPIFKDFKVKKHENEGWCFHLKIEVGVFILKVKIKHQDF